MSSNGKKSDSEKVEFVYRLPVNWKLAKDPETGRIYFYHSKTRQTSWEPPACDDAGPAADAVEEVEMVRKHFCRLFRIFFLRYILGLCRCRMFYGCNY
jgi:hypothetical protein